jgi:hypothetical protein
MDQTPQYQYSTKKNPAILIYTNVVNPLSPPDKLSPTGEDACSHACFLSVMAPTGHICTDQTGYFVNPSSNDGNNYIF